MLPAPRSGVLGGRQLRAIITFSRSAPLVGHYPRPPCSQTSDELQWGFALFYSEKQNVKGLSGFPRIKDSVVKGWVISLPRFPNRSFSSFLSFFLVSGWLMVASRIGCPALCLRQIVATRSARPWTRQKSIFHHLKSIKGGFFYPFFFLRVP